MRFFKRELGKKVVVKWDDPVTFWGKTIEYVLKEGLAKKESIGWLEYYNKDVVIVKHEKCKGDKEGDFTIIARSLITEVRVLDD